MVCSCWPPPLLTVAHPAVGGAQVGRDKLKHCMYANFINTTKVKVKLFMEMHVPLCPMLPTRRIKNSASTVFGRCSPPASRPLIEMCMPSVLDDSLAPEGCHVASLFTQYTPYHRRDGVEWDETARKQYAEKGQLCSLRSFVLVRCSLIRVTLVSPCCVDRGPSMVLACLITLE